MSDIQQRSTLNTTNCLTQIMLTKRLYLEASSFAVRHDAVSSGIAISMFQDAIELYIWTLIKERNLSAKDQAGLVSHIECLQKASINIPNAAKLLELNKARVGFHLARSALQCRYPVGNSQQVLNVVTHLVCHQHIINLIRGTLPHWQSQNTSMNIEASSLNLLVLHYKILSGKEFGKLGLDFVLNGHCSVAYERIIQKNPAV